MPLTKLLSNNTIANLVLLYLDRHKILPWLRTYLNLLDMNSSKENEKHIINSVIRLIDDVVSYFDKHVDYVNDLNVFPVPDGDTGTNMYRTLKGVQSRIQVQ